MQRLILAVAVVGCGSVKSPPPAIDGSVADIDASIPVDGSVDGPAVRRWALVQTRSIAGVDPGPLMVPVSPLGAGHLVVIAMAIVPPGSVGSVTDDSHCNSYVSVPMSRSISQDMGVALELYYATNSCAGGSTIEISASIPGGPVTALISSAVVWEVSGIKTDDPLDIAAALSDQPMSTTPRSPRITTTAPGEFVVAAALADAEITGIHAGNEFTKDSLVNGNGWAHLTDSNAPAGVHQAQWDQTPSGVFCASAAAFQVGP